MLVKTSDMIGWDRHQGERMSRNKAMDLCIKVFTEVPNLKWW